MADHAHPDQADASEPDLVPPLRVLYRHARRPDDTGYPYPQLQAAVEAHGETLSRVFLSELINGRKSRANPRKLAGAVAFLVDRTPPERLLALLETGELDPAALGHALRLAGRDPATLAQLPSLVQQHRVLDKLQQVRAQLTAARLAGTPQNDLDFLEHALDTVREARRGRNPTGEVE